MTTLSYQNLIKKTLLTNGELSSTRLSELVRTQVTKDQSAIPFNVNTYKDAMNNLVSRGDLMTQKDPMLIGEDKYLLTASLARH